MFRYYRNDSYAGEKGQYAKVWFEKNKFANEAQYIAREHDGKMSSTNEKNQGGFDQAWKEVDKDEWDAIALDWDKFSKIRDEKVDGLPE